MAIFLCGLSPIPKQKSRIDICAEAANVLYETKIKDQQFLCELAVAGVLCVKDKPCEQDAHTFCKVGARLKLMDFLNICLGETGKEKTI
jgi:hypothetical protein